MDNSKYEVLMAIPVFNEKICKQILGMYKEGGCLEEIRNHYGIPEDECRKILLQELLIDGMTVGIFMHSIHFLVVNIDKETANASLAQALRNNILMAGIYMTNVSPEKRAELEKRI